MEQRISLITLGVADMDAAAGFYQALGWVKTWAWMPRISVGFPE